MGPGVGFKENRQGALTGAGHGQEGDLSPTWASAFFVVSRVGRDAPDPRRGRVEGDDIGDVAELTDQVVRGGFAQADLAGYPHAERVEAELRRHAGGRLE